MTLLVARMIEERFHRDVEDRPIREGRTPSEHLREGDIEYRTCPYAGARHQHANPMNVSALRQMATTGTRCARRSRFCATRTTRCSPSRSRR